MCGWQGLAVACMRAQGLPSLVAAAATGTKTLSEKTRHAAKKVLAKLLHAEGLGEETGLRAYELDRPQQVAALLRMIRFFLPPSLPSSLPVYVRACVRVRVCARVRACLPACVRACVRACLPVYAFCCV